MKRIKTLHEYVKEKGINLQELSEITGVARTQLYLMANNPAHNVKRVTMTAIMEGTDQEFGYPLYPWDYLEGWDKMDKF